MSFLQVKNRAFSTLAADITATATSLTVATGEGVKFPTSNFHITIDDEILLCTARTGDTFTVERAKEGTTAASHSAGAKVELRITAGIIQELQNRKFTTLSDVPTSYTGQAGKVLKVKATEDGLEFGTGLPSGTSGQTLRYDGTNWVADSLLFNDGTNIGIGTTTPTQKLDVVGSARIGDNVGIGPIVPDTRLTVSAIADTTTFTKLPFLSKFLSLNAYEAGVGAGIILGGKYDSMGNYTAFGVISGVKENATDGNYAGQLRFGARRNAGSAEVDLVITSTGTVSVGSSTNPGSTKFIVLGPLTHANNLPYNIVAHDTAPAAQNVGGGIGFGGSADIGRTFAAIKGGHESAVASEYAGDLRFYTRVHGEDFLRERVRITSAGNVGIGTDVPLYKLDVVGTARAVNYNAGINIETLTADKTLDPAVDKMYQYLDPGTDNRIITLATTTAYAGDRFVIRHNGAFNSSYSFRIQQGAIILDYLYAGAIKEFIFDGTNWVAAGTGTGEPDEKVYNVSIGCRANSYFFGTAVGYNAFGYSLGVAVGSYAYGYQSGAAVGYGASGEIHGAAVGYSASGYSYGAAVGSYAKGMRYGAAVGYQAGVNIDTTADRYNVLMGAYSGYQLTTGIGNIILGYQSGYDATYSPTTGSKNILIGFQAGTPATTTSNFLNIGNLIFATGVNTATGAAVSDGNVGIGTTTPANILTIAQNSATDPIADSWITYACDRKNKEIIRSLNPHGFLDKIVAQTLYEWKRKPDDPKKAKLPKFSSTRIGIMIDDKETPKEILALDEKGNYQGIDLLAYIGYLHAALKELALEVKKLKGEK